MRKVEKKRKTSETEIVVKLNIDGSGASRVRTGIGFLDHMLELFAFWGLFDLEITAANCDLNVDIHHTNEDVGIVLGQAFKEALGDKHGIKRIGFASVPMEDVIANVTVDISGRAWYKLRGSATASIKAGIDDYSFDDAQHFFDAFTKHLGMNLSITLDQFMTFDTHAVLEPVFKALGIALDQATQIDPRRKGVPSTKGVID